MKKILLIVCGLLMWASAIQAQIFYKVSGNGLEKPSYIFGTHHIAPLSVIDSVAGARKALADADRIVGEIDMTMGQMQLAAALQPFMMAPTDSTLRDLIAPADYERISEKFKEYAPMPGLTLDALSMMRPMVAQSIVSLSSLSKDLPGYNPQEQLDGYFQTEGKKAGKEVIGLETPEMQGRLLYTFTPITRQAADLVEMLDHPEKITEQSKKLNASYLAQDLDALLMLTEVDDSHSEFVTALLDRRNADWLTKLPAILSEGSCFVAVGALHLAGPKGIVEGLRSLGYTVEPMMKK